MRHGLSLVVAPTLATSTADDPRAHSDQGIETMMTRELMTEEQHTDDAAMADAQLDAVVGGVEFDLSMIIEGRLTPVAFPGVQEVSGVEMSITGEFGMPAYGEHVLY